MEKSPAAIYDELLVLRCQDGDEQALEELVGRWQARLLRHAERLTQRQDVAWDMVQESWLVIVRRLRRLDDPACFPKWAYRIVSNKCVDWTRGQQRRRKLAEQAAADAASSTADSPLEALSAADEVTQLRIALRKMPAEQRAVLSMCYLDAMPLSEMAEVLGVPVGTVKSRLFTARAQLRTVLKGMKT